MPPITRAATAELPTGEIFGVTADALEMIGVFGGTLHCYEGPGGCRATGLYFSRSLPRKPIHCTLHPAGVPETPPARTRMRHTRGSRTSR
ncbi:hypothetical protein [Arthrobacter sp.]|uniref:hypothetical protein n=1 Tax=Arthrobacter sp. TaxID=1667 RepID=UPI003A95D532